MIVTDVALHFARDGFITRKNPRYDSLDNDDPASLHLLVHLVGAENIGSQILVAVLYLKHPPEEPDETAAIMGRRPYPLTSLLWQEVERKTITAEHGHDFTDFLWEFCHDSPYQIRVQFLLKTENDTSPPQVIGEAVTELSEIVVAELERLDVDVRNTDRPGELVGRAEFALEWCKQLEDEMLLEVRVKIRRKHGWPFSSKRPFFVLYRWEPQQKSWTPLYRSEVLTKVTDSPEAKGSMCFQMAEVKLKQANNGEDNRPLRIEFFHYKTTDTPKLLGYLGTSLMSLRQAPPGAELKLELNTFPEGELVGQLRLNHKRITASRCFFQLQAEFGGAVIGNFVYFDISVAVVRGAVAPGTGWKRFAPAKPFYVISRYRQSGKWEEVYRSEMASSILGNRLHKYKVAKVTEKKLNGGYDTGSLSITFYKDRMGSEPVKVGHIATTIVELIDTAPGSVIPIEMSTPGAHGYVRLEQTEETDSRLYFAIHAVLGQSAGEALEQAREEVDEREDEVVIVEEENSFVEAPTDAMGPD